ncbi:MAG: hypothetical protein EA353_03090 [Puniceicoccaceae bacterium]|nr:MAG: hypothetical protein EA353_03090 [Puniceicoccaceae bacterium]
MSQIRHKKDISLRQFISKLRTVVFFKPHNKLQQSPPKQHNNTTNLMKKLIPVISAALGLALATTASASDQALLDLLVEKGLVSSSEAAALKKEAASKSSRAIVTSSSTNIDSLQIRGRVQGQFGYASAKNDNGSGDYNSLELRRVRLGMRGNLAQNVRAQIEANFVPNDAKDFTVRSAFLQWREHDFAHVKVGADKPVFGYEENTSSASIKTVERSMISGIAAPGVMNGVTVDGKLGGMFSYATGFYTDETNRNNDGTSGRYLYGLSGGLKLDDLLPEDHKLGLRLDLLKANDRNGNFGDPFETGVSISAHYSLAPFDLRAEYIQLETFDKDTTRGWYIMPSFFATDKLEFVGRYEQAKSDNAQGIRAASRYARNVDNGILGGGAEHGDKYHAFYLGANYYFAGDAHKVMLGVERSELETDTAGDLKATTVYGAWRMLF